MDEATQKWLEQVKAWLTTNPGEEAIMKAISSLDPAHQQIFMSEIVTKGWQPPKVEETPAPAAQYAESLRSEPLDPRSDADTQLSDLFSLSGKSSISDFGQRRERQPTNDPQYEQQMQRIRDLRMLSGKKL